ncbi:MAG: IS3 family transposase [Bacteroidales bacterium]|nr:IS3 family transposase [Bacteroidales bacterium]
MWHQTVSLLREECREHSLSTLCGLFGYSRQSYYKRDVNDFAEDAIEPLIVEKAQDYRRNNPGLGCAKLYLIIKDMFEETGCMPGRDAFIELLRKNGLMVQIKRRKRYRTTDSNHNYRKYPNLIEGVIPHRPNEIWVADITYVETDEGVCYLSLITDAYSHKIVGWAVGPTLETAYPLEALYMALSTLQGEEAEHLIHHSDRGCQYCSMAYVNELKKRGISISMTQSGDPLENAVAERANGILKTEWLYKMKIETRQECSSVLKRIIGFYNNERPHMSIGMQTPEVAHTQTGEQRRCWKNYYNMS